MKKDCRVDCFGYGRKKDGTDKCMALKEIDCEGCKFFKTIDEFAEGLTRSKLMNKIKIYYTASSPGAVRCTNITVEVSDGHYEALTGKAVISKKKNEEIGEMIEDMLTSLAQLQGYEEATEYRIEEA